MSGEESRSPPTGCQCRPSAVTVSSGTITASETSAPTPRRSAKPRRTSGRTAKSLAAHPHAAEQAAQLRDLARVLRRLGHRDAQRQPERVRVGDARHRLLERARRRASGRASPPRAPSIEDCSTSRSQPASRASSRSRRPPRNSIALVRQTVGSRDGGVLEHVDDLRLDERLAAGDVDLLEALGDRLVDERAEALEPERAPARLRRGRHHAVVAGQVAVEVRVDPQPRREVRRAEQRHHRPPVARRPSR